jgi:outer membrane protein TolC
VRDVKAAFFQVLAAEALVEASEQLQLVQGGFEQGKFGFIELLDTQPTTAEARLTYQQKLLELNVAQAELDALLSIVPTHPQPMSFPK